MTGNLTKNGEENNDAGDRKVGERHGEVSMFVGGAFEHGGCHTPFRSQRL